MRLSEEDDEYYKEDGSLMETINVKGFKMSNWEKIKQLNDLVQSKLDKRVYFV